MDPREEQCKSQGVRLTLATDSLCVEGNLCGAHLLQLRHPGFQGLFARRLHALVPLPQHLSDPHHGEPAPAFHTVWAAQGVAGGQLGRGHCLLLCWIRFLFVGEGDLGGVDRGRAPRGKQRGQCPFTRAFVREIHWGA